MPVLAHYSSPLAAAISRKLAHVDSLEARIKQAQQNNNHGLALRLLRELVLTHEALASLRERAERDWTQGIAQAEAKLPPSSNKHVEAL